MDTGGPTHPKTLREHFGRALAESRARRPFSFYLLFAIVIVVLLGAQIVYVRDNPKQFALFLALNFIFFFVVLFRALVDAFEIVRDHFRAREAVYRSTLGDPEFTRELGKRVAESDEPWERE